MVRIPASNKAIKTASKQSKKNPRRSLQSYLGKILVHHNPRPRLSSIVVVLGEFLKDRVRLLFRDSDPAQSIPGLGGAVHVGRPWRHQIATAAAVLLVPHLVGLMVSSRRSLDAGHGAPANSRRWRRHVGGPAYVQRSGSRREQQQRQRTLDKLVSMRYVYFRSSQQWHWFIPGTYL